MPKPSFEAAAIAPGGGANEAVEPVERARRFLVASWQGIAGKQIVKSSWRLDLGKSWLIPAWSSLPDRLLATARRLKAVHVHRKHIRDLVAMFGDRPNAFLFLDPPYPRHTIATHEIVYAVDMTEAEHAALAEQLSQVRCRVMLTMAEDTVYQQLLPGWISVPYSVRGMRNAVKQEVALLNYTAPARTLFCGAAE